MMVTGEWHLPPSIVPELFLLLSRYAIVVKIPSFSCVSVLVVPNDLSDILIGKNDAALFRRYLNIIMAKILYVYMLIGTVNTSHHKILFPDLVSL